jgi:hypothetical protein
MAEASRLCKGSIDDFLADALDDVDEVASRVGRVRVCRPPHSGREVGRQEHLPQRCVRVVGGSGAAMSNATEPRITTPSPTLPCPPALASGTATIPFPPSQPQRRGGHGCRWGTVTERTDAGPRMGSCGWSGWAAKHRIPLLLWHLRPISDALDATFAEDCGTG